MIRNVRIHLEGALPVLADLRALPEATDVSLMCTNMRTTDGKRPSFIEHSESWFVIPLSVVRFVELPATALESAGAGAETGTGAGRGAAAADESAAEADFETDESFLQRIRDI